MPTESSLFIDTNILVYEWDQKDQRKREVASALLRKQRRRIVISTQVLQEVAVTLTKKLHMPWHEVREVVGFYSKLKVVSITPSLIQGALQTCADAKLSFWDALIIESAAEAGCRRVYSEDMNSGQVIRGVEIVNPFA